MLLGSICICSVGFFRHKCSRAPCADELRRVFETVITLDALKLRNTIQLIGILRKY